MSDGMETHQRAAIRKVEQESDTPNPARHRIAALWREGMNVKGRSWAARGARGR